MQKLSQYRTMPEAPFSVQQCLCVSGDPVRAQALSVLIPCTTHTHAKVEILATFPTSVSGDSPSRQLFPEPYQLHLDTQHGTVLHANSHSCHHVWQELSLCTCSAHAHQALMLNEFIPLGPRSSNSLNLKRLTMSLLATRGRTAPHASHQYPRGCLDTCTGCRFKWEPFKGMYELHVGPAGHARGVACFSKHQGGHAQGACPLQVTF